LGGSGVPLSQKLSRVPLTDRSSLKGVTGILIASLRLLDKVHVGSGEFNLIVSDWNAVKRLSQEVLASKAIERVGAQAVNLMSISLKFTRVGQKVCIPGSAIKGVIRTRLELMAGKRGSGNVTSVCLSFARPRMKGLPAPGSQGWRHARIWGLTVLVDREPESYLEEEQIFELCPVCNLFGAPGTASRVLFSDMCCDNCSTQMCAISEYNMRVDVLPPGTMLKSSIVLRGVTVEELGLLIIGMGFDGINFKPILIGRMKYSCEGMGKAVFSIEKLRVATYSLDYIKGLGVSIKQSTEGFVIEGEELKKLINVAFSKARERYPDVEPFSEAEEKENLSSQLNLVRCI